MPESAPETHAPSAPMLFRMAVRATVASLLSQESSVARLGRTLARPEQTRPLTVRRDRSDMGEGCQGLPRDESRLRDELVKKPTSPLNL